ncbi:MAG: glucose 1-dehydrogenase [Rhodospirillales bacterium]|nr:glucose 1-dehydrogenase [Rhodospirillales bacterium]MDE2575749.1 glucose 1-dehydrogenase [Rhodospirillales bacterium]
MSHWLGLSGRVAVVTGGGGGMGRAIGAALAEAGAAVAFLDRATEGAEDAAAAVRAAGGRAMAAACDVAQPDSIVAASGQVSCALGAPDILVNNAALLRPGALDTLALAEWNAILAVNLTGYLLCAQAFGQPMLARGRGSIVHVASIAGAHPQGGSGAYSAGKAAVIMLSRQLATEWGPRGVRSNVVSPGLIRTPMSEAFYATPGVTERRSAVVPARRIGTPEDIADAVLFLASDRASYVSGDEITVDGGFTRMVMNLIPRPTHD